jgi:hypothetical protein
MNDLVSTRRARGPEPLVLLVPLLMLPLLTAAGLAGTVLHVPHSSLVLYWPVALLVAGGVACCKPARDHPFEG